MTPRILLIGCLVLTLLVPGPCLAQMQFDKVEYLMAPPPGKKKGPTVKGMLAFDSGAKEIVFVGKSAGFNIQYDSIKTMLYERTSKPRYAEAILLSPLFLLAKSKKHFVTIQFTDASGTGQFVLIRLDKGNWQRVVATMEAETGKKIERVEER